MAEKTVTALAETYGLTVETTIIPDNPRAYRVYKGANQLFIGTEEAVREFLDGYGKQRPDLYMGSMYGYKE